MVVIRLVNPESPEGYREEDQEAMRGDNDGGSGDVYIDPGIWKDPNPHVTYSPL